MTEDIAVGVEDITQVMIGQAWYVVRADGDGAAARSTFTVAPYAYTEVRAGQDVPQWPVRGTTRYGFCFQGIDGQWLAGPVESVAAVRYRR